METTNITAMGVLTLMPSTKTQAAEFAQAIIDDVNSGRKNPLELAVLMNALEKTLKVIKDSVNDSILKEASTYGEKSFDAYGAAIQLSELGTKYDFESCGDPEWEMADTAERSAKETKAQREKFLKALSKPMTIVFQGSDCVINPPVKRSTSGIKITLK